MTASAEELQKSGEHRDGRKVSMSKLDWKTHDNSGRPGMMNAPIG